MSTQFTTSLLGEFQQFMETRQAEHHVPGVAVGLLTPQGPHTFTAGVTSLENPLPVTDHTLFLLGSIGKTYTGTLVMQLIEQGRLSLETRVLDIVPDLKLMDEEASRNLTIQHLLTHSGGWWEQTDEDTGDGDDALARHVAKLAEVPQIFAPGQQFSYSNSGFNLLGRVIEKVTGQAYEAAMTSRVLEPLGLSETFFFPVDVMTRRFAVGHEEKEGEWQVTRPWTLPRAGNASGGLSSSVHDQLTYAAFHLGQMNSNAVLQDRTRQQMQTPHIPVDDNAHGLPWHLHQRGGMTIVSHNGGMPGQHADMWLIPELGVAGVILTNSDGGPALYDVLTGWLYQHCLKLPERQAEPFKGRVDPADYLGHYSVVDPAEFLGNYSVSQVAEAYLLGEENGQFILSLKIANEPPTLLCRLEFKAPDMALAVNCADSRLEGLPHCFLRGESGKVEFMRVFGRVIPRQKTTL